MQPAATIIHLALAHNDGGQIFCLGTRIKEVSTAIPSSNLLILAKSKVPLGVVGTYGTQILGDDHYLANMGHRKLSRIRINPEGPLAALHSRNIRI